MSGDSIMLGDVEIPVVSSEEAEDSDFVVCVRADEPTPFTNNLTGVCFDCAVAVQFRPSAPKRPKENLHAMHARSRSWRPGMGEVRAWP